MLGRLAASRQKVAVAMSGGVDSSVVALLLKRQGFDVEAVHMQNWDPLAETASNERRSRCSAERDLSDAEEVCKQLGVRLRTVSFEREYWSDVFQPSLGEYESGLVPNPDILCNRHIKFNLLVRHCQEQLECSWIATGHYARLQPIPDPLLPDTFPFKSCARSAFPPQSHGDRLDVNSEKDSLSPAGSTSQRGLFRAADSSKDQSYFLAAVNATNLQHVLFPLGDICKLDVRRIAAEAQLATAKKRDSTGICFIGEKKKFREFLSDYIRTEPGEYLPLQPSYNEAKIIRKARHDGAGLYTVGQRAKLHSMEQAWFIYDKDIATNQLLICKGESHPKLFSASLLASHVHWIHSGSQQLFLGQVDRVRLRSSGAFIDVASLHWTDNGLLQVKFMQPERGVSPGQYVVFYSGDFVLGCAKIQSRIQ